ncbi:MAG: STAS-like domain-containing protein [Magnetococcales bacterium]|nr:STAS-like domain-containing protein [Magnetococcales bacterium]
MMGEFREAAAREMGNGPGNDPPNEDHVVFFNYFGRFAEDKQAAIQFRNRRLLPATREGKVVIFDFAGVESAPHSFLNALLAEPVRELGIKAFKRLKFRNTNDRDPGYHRFHHG